MTFWFEVVTAAVMVALAVWQWRQVARHRGDVALRILAGAVTTLAFVLTMGIDVAPLRAVNEALSVVSFSNIAWTFMFYCYSVFFLLAGAGGPGPSRSGRVRRAWIELGVWAVFLTAGLLALKVGDPDVFGKDRDPESYRSARNVVYYVGVSVYPLAVWVLGTVRARGYLRLVGHRLARVAILGVIVGTGLMMAGVNGVSLLRQGLYIVYPGSKWPTLTDWYNVGRMGGQILLALALASAPIAATASRLRDRADRRRRQTYRARMEPLWRTLMDEFPHLRLPGAGRDDDPSRPPEFERMTIEISDGLAHLAQDAPGTGDRTASGPRGVATEVRAALEARGRRAGVRWAEDEPVDGGPARWEPDFGVRWRERADWMARVADELAAPRPHGGLDRSDLDRSDLDRTDLDRTDDTARR